MDQEQLVKRVRSMELLHGSNIRRAHTAGQGHALKALLQEIDSMRYNTEGSEAEYAEGYHSSMESLKFWIDAKLKELGEEAREVRNEVPRAQEHQEP